MARKYGFVSYTNKFGFTELISASKISMIYRDEETTDYTVLFDDGSEVILDLTRSDIDNLIKRLVCLDSL